MADDRGKKTILIIEDEPLSMKLAVDLLKLNGFNTLSCGDGNSALGILKSTAPDLILLDINLPGMSGLDVYKKIRENTALDGVKVIAISASAMKEDEEKIMSAGFDAFVSKPLDIKNFLAKVRELIKK